MRDPLPDNQAQPSAAGTLPAATPVQIPDHDLIRCVGKGSYGEVWLARNIVGTRRAVKVVRRKEAIRLDPNFARPLGQSNYAEAGG